MDRDLARTLDRDVAAGDSDVRPAGRRQADALGRRPVDVRVGADDVDVVARLNVEHVPLRLQVDRVLGRDQLQPNIALARLDRPAQHADGSAAVHAHLAAGGELRVLPAHQGDGFAVGQLQILPGQHAQTRLGGDGDDGAARVRQLVVGQRDRFIRRLGLRRIDAVLAQHAGGGRQHRLERRDFVEVNV